MRLAMPVLAGLVILTWMRLGVWVNGERLFADALKTNPGSWKAQQNYGCIVDDLGDHNTAIRHLNESLRIRPDNAEAYNDLGAAYALAGRSQDAIASLRRSLQIRPMSSTVRNLVVMLLRTGHPREAEEEARRGEQLFISAGNMAEAQWVRDQVLRGLKSP